MKWSDLSWQQKTVVWIVIAIAGCFAPEIAMLVHFGGIEAAFAFLFVFFTPAAVWLKHHYQKARDSITLAVVSLQTSASAKPKTFAVQASFCCLAFALTGSAAFAMSFFMPGILFNSMLI
ncbi:hypothetical protein [Alteromonas sp. H39]|uniref:hypothetical protein n=1 Tax=Alteromonas sp. H39 TaxID=3389876 RepID=UPI0039E027BE